jgi:hypothetical protein
MPPTTTLTSTPPAMDDDPSVHDVFSSGHLWRQSTLFDAPDAHESTLFAPLQLDSEFVACLHPHRVEPN